MRLVQAAGLRAVGGNVMRFVRRSPMGAGKVTHAVAFVTPTMGRQHLHPQLHQTFRGQ